MLLTFASLFPLQIDSGSGEHFDVSHFYVVLFSTVKPTHLQTLEMSVPAVHIVLQYRVVSRVQMNQLSHTFRLPHTQTQLRGISDTLHLPAVALDIFKPV